MRPEERKIVAKVLMDMGILYSKELTASVLSMYLDDLEDLEMDDVLRACSTYRRDKKNFRFPLPAQLRSIIEPELDPDVEASQVVGDIFKAIKKYGYTNSSGARAEMGELAWMVVEAFGGWLNLCSSSDLGNQGTVRAQMREMARSKFERHKMGIRDMPAQLPPGQTRTLQGQELQFELETRQHQIKDHILKLSADMGRMLTVEEGQILTETISKKRDEWLLKTQGAKIPTSGNSLVSIGELTQRIKTLKG